MDSQASLSVRDRIKARLGIVRRDLDEVIGRLSDDMLPWAPSPGMRTVAGQLYEIAGTEMKVISWMRDGVHLTSEDPEEFEEAPPTVESLTQILADVRKDTLEYLDSLSDEEIEALAPFPEDWFEGLGYPTMNRSEALRSIAQHEWYHVGQLTSYLWARGDDPYGW